MSSSFSLLSPRHCTFPKSILIGGIFHPHVQWRLDASSLVEVPTPSPALPCFFDPGRASQSRRSTLDRRRCGGTCPIRTNLTSALDSTPLEAEFRNKSGWSQILWCHGCRGWVLSASLDIRRRKAFGFEYTFIAWRKKEPLAPRTTHSGNLKCPLSFSAA